LFVFYLFLLCLLLICFFCYTGYTVGKSVFKDPTQSGFLKTQHKAGF
jgi:hypothetical protein